MLAEVPGIGPISALSLVLRVDFTQFQSGRHFAAWLGLTPREHCAGGKTRLGGISHAGDERLRQLLVLGATAVIRTRQVGTSPSFVALWCSVNPPLKCRLRPGWRWPGRVGCTPRRTTGRPKANTTFLPWSAGELLR